MVKERLTNEVFRDKCKSQFELVNSAIKNVAQLINSGRASRVKIDTQNPALIILAEMAANKDILLDIDSDDDDEVGIEEIQELFQSTRSKKK